MKPTEYPFIIWHVKHSPINFGLCNGMLRIFADRALRDVPLNLAMMWRLRMVNFDSVLESAVNDYLIGVRNAVSADVWDIAFESALEDLRAYGYHLTLGSRRQYKVPDWMVLQQIRTVSPPPPATPKTIVGGPGVITWDNGTKTPVKEFRLTGVGSDAPRKMEPQQRPANREPIRASSRFRVDVSFEYTDPTGGSDGDAIVGAIAAALEDLLQGQDLPVLVQNSAREEFNHPVNVVAVKVGISSDGWRKKSK